MVPKENVNIDLNYVLGLMNSSLYNFLYTHISQEAEGKAFSQVKTVFIKKLPIKLNADQNYINLIVQFVRRIIEIVNSSDFERSIKKQQAVKEYENQIDILVYKLYNLTYDEILVIDQNFSMSEEEYSNYGI